MTVSVPIGLSIAKHSLAIGGFAAEGERQIGS